MAHIDLQRTDRSSHGWLWALLAAAAAIALLAFIFWPDDEAVEAEPVATGVEETTEPAEGVAVVFESGFPIAAILDNPSNWIGRTVDGEVDVGAAVTDRGFWVNHQGRQLLAIITDQPRDQRKDINGGQKLRISKAMVRDADTNLDQLEGKPLDQDTRALIQQQKVFLLVDEANIEILRPAG